VEEITTQSGVWQGKSEVALRTDENREGIRLLLEILAGYAGYILWTIFR
jgi:hypothetical protein